MYYYYHHHHDYSRQNWPVVSRDDTIAMIDLKRVA